MFYPRVVLLVFPSSENSYWPTLRSAFDVVSEYFGLNETVVVSNCGFILLFCYEYGVEHLSYFSVTVFFFVMYLFWYFAPSLKGQFLFCG